jgi:general secretion pathway protein G
MHPCIPRIPVHHGTARSGFTLIELVVALAILSILAAAAIPYAELTITRSKELELRRSLREVRTAIDRLHDDWETGKISRLGNSISDDGYPRTLQVLFEGVESSEAKGGKRKYLRRIPEDPFGEPGKPPAEQWVLRGYQDEPDALSWNGRDVYDIRTQSDRAALDGTRYREW